MGTELLPGQQFRCGLLIGSQVPISARTCFFHPSLSEEIARNGKS